MVPRGLGVPGEVTWVSAGPRHHAASSSVGVPSRCWLPSRRSIGGPFLLGKRFSPRVPTCCHCFSMGEPWSGHLGKGASALVSSSPADLSGGFHIRGVTGGWGLLLWGWAACQPAAACPELCLVTAPYSPWLTGAGSPHVAHLALGVSGPDT